MTSISLTGAASKDLPEFDHLTISMNNHVKTLLMVGDVFATAADPEIMWEAYLDGFETPELRQEHNCRCCRHFIKNYGHLVVIDAQGRQSSLVWNANTSPVMYRESVERLQKLVDHSKVTNEFFHARAPQWGIEESGGWGHFVLDDMSKVAQVTNVTLSPYQSAAKTVQDFGTLEHGLRDYKHDYVKQALTILQSGSLARNEKLIGPTTWLHNLHTKLEGARGRNRTNLMWNAVAGAPDGFCQPRSTMIGTLLDDLVSGIPFEDIKRKYNSKMAVDKYQTPVAAPSAGTITQAEKLFAQLNLAGALNRRYATVDDMPAIWKTRPLPSSNKPEAGGSLFGHLKPAAPVAAPVDLPAVNITWEKFRRTVLPGALKIETYVRPGNANYCGFITAVDPTAAPLLQYDELNQRNPVSWYVYTNGSTPDSWNLSVMKWYEVPAIVLQPNKQYDESKYDHLGNSVTFLIEGIADSRNSSLGLFPELIRSELHGVRSVIERFSRTSKLEGTSEGSAGGIRLNQSASNKSIVVRVTTEIGVTKYELNRWD